MSAESLRDFILQLEGQGEFRRITQTVDPCLEITEICRRALRAGGPALLFERPKGFRIPVLGNLFGTTRRVALAIGRESISELREIGRMLAILKEPQLPRSLGEAVERLPDIRHLFHMPARVMSDAACQQNVIAGSDVDLSALPIQTCWPEDAGPLITFGLVVTRGPYKERQNIGIYRQQLIGPNKVIMRWLPHRGGAIDYREWQEAYPRKRFPVAVVIGADPATLVAAVTPIPDTLSEYQLAARSCDVEPARCRCRCLQSSYSRATSSLVRRRSRDRLAITRATTTRRNTFRCLPLIALRIETAPFITAPTWVGHHTMSPQCWRRR